MGSFWCNNYLKISCKKFKYIQDLYWICRYMQCFAPQCNGRSSSMGARFCKQPKVQSCLSPASLTHTSKFMIKPQKLISVKCAHFNFKCVTEKYTYFRVYFTLKYAKRADFHSDLLVYNIGNWWLKAIKWDLWDAHISHNSNWNVCISNTGGSDEDCHRWSENYHQWINMSNIM